MNLLRTTPRLFSVLFFVCLIPAHGQIQTATTQLDLRSRDLATKRISLSGNWNFYPNKLITPNSSQSLPSASTVQFPLVWNDPTFGDEKINYGTYALRVLVPHSGESLALEIPQMFSSYRLWLNGQELAHNGQVGERSQNTHPQWLPQTVVFTPTKDTLQLVLQVANFYHIKGGFKDPIYIGSSELLAADRSVAEISNLVEAIGLVVSGLIFLLVWQMERKKVTLYFTLLCITWAVRSVFSNLYLAVAFAPDLDWTLMVRIEYITLYLTMIWAILFLNRLFPAEGSLIIKYLLVGVNILFLVCTVFTVPLFFTQLLPVYLGFCAFLLAYALYIILRAWVNDHAGVWYMISSVLMGIGIFAYDFLSYEGVFPYSPVIMGIGYLVIFGLTAVSLLFHLNIIKSKPSTATLTYKELYGENKS